MLELSEDLVHDSGGQQNFAMGNRLRAIAADRTVERFDQMLHAGLHMKILARKSSEVSGHVRTILLCQCQWGSEFLEITFEFGASKVDQRLLILIENQTVLQAIDAELMKRWPHLRGKSEVGCSSIKFRNHRSQLVHDLGFAQFSEKWTSEAMRHDLRRVGAQILRNAGNTVTDDVLQQLSRQPAHPVRLVPEKRARVG